MKKLYLYLLLAATVLPGSPYAFSISENPLLAVASISGPVDGCLGGTAQYTAVGSSATSGYTWNLPSGLTIDPATAGAKTITVNYTGAGMGQYLSVGGNGISASINVNVYAPPSGSGVIDGASSVCAGQAGVSYTLNGVGNVSSYSWFATNGATITSPITGSSITVSFPSSYTSGTVGVTGVNGPCTPTPTYTKSVSVGAVLPGAPGAISGAQIITPGQMGVSYSVGAVADAASYKWTLPSGSYIDTGDGTNSITVNYTTSFTGGSMTVKGSNSVCDGPSSPAHTLTPDFMPRAAGPISGNFTPCVSPNSPGYTDVTFSVDEIVNAQNYLWSFAAQGVTPVGQTNLRFFTLRIPYSVLVSTFNLSVQATNPYGSGTPSPTRTVTIYKPAQTPGAIAGFGTVCAGATEVEYSVPAITNALGYVWGLPAGASITAGYGTRTIKASFPASFTSGTISVFGTSGSCGAGPSATLPVSIPAIPTTAGAISGATAVCPGSTNVPYAIPSIATATGYVWTLPAGASIVDGLNTNSIKVDFTSTPSPGVISVYGTNCTRKRSSFQY